MRCVDVVFAATLYDTEPLPDPFAPAVTVIQALLLAAVHAHPDVAVTATDPVVAADVIERLVGEIDGVAQAGEYENEFETALWIDPPGPLAATRASNKRPGVGSWFNNGRKSTLITPPVPGVGFPRFTDSNGIDDPSGYIDSV